MRFCFFQTHNPHLNSKPLPVQIWGAAANPARPSGQQSEYIYHQCSVKTAQDQDVPLYTSPPPVLSSVSGLGVELLADVVDDLGYKFVEIVELINKEGVLLVWVRGDVLQLILGCPGNADGVGDHT